MESDSLRVVNFLLENSTSFNYLSNVANDNFYLVSFVQWRHVKS